MVTDVSGWGVRPLWSMIPAGGSGCSEWLTNPGTLVVRIPPSPAQHYAKVRVTCQKIGHNPTMAPAKKVKDPHQKPNRAICE